MDIGTNNEMVMGSRDGMWACSAAAGPALEGALYLRTIQNVSPKGLCGSGLIDILAVLLREGVILPSGRFAAAESLPEGDLSAWLRKDAKHHTEFVYCRKGEYGAEQDLILKQKDVRETQLAKSAISVGISKLLERFGAKTEDPDAVYWAGT